MNYSILKFEIKDEHLPWKEDVLRVLENCLGELIKKYPLPKTLQVTVFDVNVQGMVSAGYAPSAESIELYVNYNFPNLTKELFELRLKQTIFHEFHHVLRWLDPGYGTTMLDALVAEGLADHYAVQNTDNKPQPHSVSLSKGKLEELKPELKKILTQENFDYSAWFPKGSKNIPRWAGYNFAWQLIDFYLKDNPEVDLIESAHLPSKDFLPFVDKL